MPKYDVFGLKHLELVAKIFLEVDSGSVDNYTVIFEDFLKDNGLMAGCMPEIPGEVSET